VYVGKDVHIEANCRIGRFCLLANRVAIVGRRDHDFRAVGYPVRYAPSVRSKIRPSPSVREEVVIEDDVWIGFGAILLTGITIRRGAIVAAGSVVTRDVAPYSIVGGSPARELGRRFADARAIATHESAIRRGRFRLSERGYDECTVEPRYE
jgi:acetyltransferase-like isoleucine patch superfamily enzyme